MKEKTRVNIKLLNDKAIIPTQGSAGAAGRDLYANLGGNNLIITPHGNATIPLGISMAIPEGWVGLVFARSSLQKKGLCLSNGVGVIDSDYRGEWQLLLHNMTATSQVINHGERLAQVVFVEYKDVVFYPVKELDKTERGEGGLGSTGN